MSTLDKIKAIQDLLGVDPDGNFGPKSRAALDAAIANATVPTTVAISAMTPNFIAFMPFILEWEGRTFENDPDDPGGATKFGIDQRSHPGVNIRDLTENEAMAIYWKEWQADGCDKMTSPYAEVYFNCAVNMGIGRAKEFAAVASGNAGQFLTFQEAKYHGIAANNKNLAKFLKGWLNRTTALRKRFGL